MSAKYTTIKGMSDVMPPESVVWNAIEATARDVFGSFGCSEVRTPILEKTELFVRSIGEATAVVEKEMYSFLDRNGDSCSMRPEGTASVVRAFIENCKDEGTYKYYYMGPMFRYERPQKGRKRQFNQIGVEVFGASKPVVDAEVMAMCHQFFSALGLYEFKLEINSIGCEKCRPAYHEKLTGFLKQHGEKVCEDCKKRIEKNPLRVFDCKNPDCHDVIEKAPLIGLNLCSECEEHFSAVQKFLELMKVPFVVNHRIVRGLDYYMRTAFEFTTDKLGAQNAICAGGRYDGLVKAMGGKDVPGVGFAMGVERLILLLETLGKLPKVDKELVFFALLGEKAIEKLLPTIATLRKDGVNVDWDYEGHSLKSQMRMADRLAAHTVVIVGDSELEKGVAVVRNMHTKEQEELSIDALPRKFVHIEL